MTFINRVWTCERSQDLPTHGVLNISFRQHLENHKPSLKQHPRNRRLPWTFLPRSTRHHWFLIFTKSVTFVIFSIITFTFTFTYPLTARVVGAPQIIWQPVFSIFLCSPLPSGLGELKACSFTDVVYPPLLLCALSSFPLNCTLQDGFGQTWWTREMSIMQFASLHDRQEVFLWSDYLLHLGTDFLVGNKIFVRDA